MMNNGERIIKIDAITVKLIHFKDWPKMADFQQFWAIFKISKFQILFIDPRGKTDTLAPLLVINVIVF